MIKFISGAVLFLLSTIALITCIDPYDPKLGGYEALLVVDGLVTNDNSSYTVRLSRSFQELSGDLDLVSDANVSVKDDLGNIYSFAGKGNGIYKSDSTQFRGSAGRRYTLQIILGNGEEYQSDPCLMEPVTDIDKIHYARDNDLSNNNTENNDGIRIYLDSKAIDSSQYLRWTYDETWQFQVPNPQKYDFLFSKKGVGTGTFISTRGRFPALPEVKELCWKNNKSDVILVHSGLHKMPGPVVNQPINFIASGKSDRLQLRYSIQVNQYSISRIEYEYWHKLQDVNESGENIFARQPFSVIGNVHNKLKPETRVLGYFQVSSVSHQRIYIDHTDVSSLGIPFYTFPCTTWMYSPADFETICHCPPKTWDDVYWYMCISSDYTFIRPVYQGASDSILVKMEFGRKECTDCSVTGVFKKPAFWDDTDK